MNITSRPVGCVIMASGLGRRFGSNKLLAPFCGKPLIQHILSITDGGLFAGRIVVTRHAEIQALCQEQQIPVLLHQFPDRNDTVRLGLSALISQTGQNGQEPMAGCMFAQSDQPLLGRKSLESLLDVFSASSSSDRICRLCHQEQPGSPVLFGSRYFEELLHLPPGKGGNFLIRKYPDQILLVSSQTRYELSDVDTPEDLLFLEKKASERSL